MLSVIWVFCPRRRTTSTLKLDQTRSAYDISSSAGHTADTQILKKLHTVTSSLKQYEHVNKKAFDQYQSFTKQRDEHLGRRDELDKSAESIQELIETLDQRKDEAIERTFKQVSKYFEEVFEALVPAGKGELVMQKKIDGYMVS